MGASHLAGRTTTTTTATTTDDDDDQQLQEVSHLDRQDLCLWYLVAPIGVCLLSKLDCHQDHDDDDGQDNNNMFVCLPGRPHSGPSIYPSCCRPNVSIYALETCWPGQDGPGTRTLLANYTVTLLSVSLEHLALSVCLCESQMAASSGLSRRCHCRRRRRILSRLSVFLLPTLTSLQAANEIPGNLAKCAKCALRLVVLAHHLASNNLLAYHHLDN